MHCRYAAWIILLAAVIGCAGPTPRERQEAKTAREEISGVLTTYGEALRADGVSRFMKLVDPALSPGETERMRKKFREASWLEMYTGYTINSEKSVATGGVEELNAGRVELRVIAENGAGVSLRDRLTLRRGSSGWVIRELQLEEPQEGDALDLPPEQERRVRPVLARLMDALRKGQVGSVLSMLPDNQPAQVRTTRPGLLAKVMGAKPEAHRIMEDLGRVARFSFADWPNVREEELPLAYIGSLTAMARYRIDYAWSEEGIYNDTLLIEIFLIRGADEWSVEMIRFYGRGIPGEE